MSHDAQHRTPSLCDTCSQAGKTCPIWEEGHVTEHCIEYRAWEPEALRAAILAEARRDSAGNPYAWHELHRLLYAERRLMAQGSTD